MYLNNISTNDVVGVFEKELPMELLGLKADCDEVRYRFISENYTRIKMAIYDCIAKQLKLKRSAELSCWGGVEPPSNVSLLEFGSFVNHVLASLMGMGDARVLLNHVDTKGLPQCQAHRLIDVDYALYQIKFNEMVISGLAKDKDIEDIGDFPGALNINATGFFKTDYGNEFGYLTIKVLHSYIVDSIAQSNDKRVMKHYPHKYKKIRKPLNEAEENWPFKIKASKRKVIKIREVNEHVDSVEDKISEELKREFEDLKLRSAWLIKEEGNVFHPKFTLVLSDSSVMESIRLRHFNDDLELFKAPISELEDISMKYLNKSHKAISLAFPHE